MDWLVAHNPSIDWTTKTIGFTCCPKECKDIPINQSPAIRQILPIDTWEPQYNDEFDKHSDGTDVMQCMVAHRHKYEGPKNAYFIPGDSPSMGRTTISTSLAKANKNEKLEGVPSKFHRFKKVFSEEAAQRLPQHQPWDHKIDLIPGQHMRKTKVYRLTPPERDALKEYIEDGLKRGTLRRSEAPEACSFFFIDKKDGKLRPVQDYRPLNDITVKNDAPIPLIPELVDKLLGA